MHKIISSLLLTLIILSGGCGIYSFSGSSLPAHIKTVSIALFEDNTAEYGINQQLTDSLIDAVTRDNSLKIASPGSGDSVIRGSILRIQDQVGQYNAQEQAGDYRITITVNVIFEDRQKRKVMWEEQISQWGRYEPSSRDDGIAEAIEKLSEQIMNRLVSDW